MNLNERCQKAQKRRKPRKPEGYWSFRRGLSEPTAEDRMEIEARTAEILAKKLAAPPMISNVPLVRLGRMALQMPSGARINGITIAK